MTDSNSGRLPVVVDNDGGDQQCTLGNLDELSFDYHIESSSLIFRYSIALGSGNGVADIYVDNLKVDGVTMNSTGKATGLTADLLSR